MKKSAQQASSYPIIVQDDGSGFFFVTCPVLAGCYSQGKTIDEALKNIQEAIALCREDLSKKDQRALSHYRVSMHAVSV